LITLPSDFSIAKAAMLGVSRAGGIGWGFRPKFFDKAALLDVPVLEALDNVLDPSSLINIHKFINSICLFIVFYLYNTHMY